MAKRKILLLEDEPDILELVADIVATGAPSCEIILCDRIQKAREAFSQQTIDLIIADQNLPDGKGHEIFELIEKQNLLTKFAICSSDRPQDIPALNGKKLYGVITKPAIFEGLEMLLQQFNAEIASVTPSTKTDAAAVGNATQEYVPVRARSLLKTQPVPCDVFLRLGDDKHIKVLNAGSVFEGEDLERYLKKNIEILYVPSKEREAFLKCLSQTVLAAYEAKNAKESDLLVAMEDSLSIAMDNIRSLGFNEDTQNIAKSFTGASINVVAKNPKLSDMMKKVMTGSHDYLGHHSMILSLVSCSMARCMSWVSDAIYLKLSLASFLHDVALDSSDLALVTDLKKEAHKFSASEVEQLKSHTLEAAHLVKAMKEIPPDVDNIILQHHERPDGSGFPSGLNAQRISPLSALFIIAHDYSRSCALQKQEVSLGGFLVVNELLYSSGNFKPVLKELQENLHKIV